MSEELIYHVKGSAPDPYVVDVTLSPLSVSCTCYAANVGLPCKHRIMILQGTDPGILEGDKSKLAIINKAAESFGVFGLLENYDKAKAEKKAIDVKAEKAFKKYRDERLRLLRGELKTDKLIIKARDGMEAAIDAIAPVAEKTQAPVAEKTQAALMALREIMPMSEYGPSAEELAEAAI